MSESVLDVFSVSIPLCGARGAGLHFIIDEVDAGWVSRFKWFLGNHGYVYANRRGQRQGRCMLLHHVLMPNRPGFVRDHINRNKLDNRMVNLRYVTRCESNVNRKRPKHATTPFRGVRFNGVSWVARIRINKQERWLGAFPTQHDAANAYNMAAVQAWPLVAQLNEVHHG